MRSYEKKDGEQRGHWFGHSRKEKKCGDCWYMTSPDADVEIKNEKETIKILIKKVFFEKNE